MTSVTDDTTYQFQIPDHQTGTNEPVTESGINVAHDVEIADRPTTWTEADADMLQMTGDMLSPETHDQKRWMEVMTSSETKLDYHEAEEDVMRRQREADFNERELHRLEKENTVEAMLAIDDTQNVVLTLRELHKKPGSELHGISQNV